MKSIIIILVGIIATTVVRVKADCLVGGDVSFFLCSVFVDATFMSVYKLRGWYKGYLIYKSA